MDIDKVLVCCRIYTVHTLTTLRAITLSKQCYATPSMLHFNYTFLFVIFPLFIYTLMDSVNDWVLHHNTPPPISSIFLSTLFIVFTLAQYQSSKASPAHCINSNEPTYYCILLYNSTINRTVMDCKISHILKSLVSPLFSSVVPFSTLCVKLFYLNFLPKILYTVINLRVTKTLFIGIGCERFPLNRHIEGMPMLVLKMHEITTESCGS